MVSLLINDPRCNLNEENKNGSTALHRGIYFNTFKLSDSIHFIIESIK